MQATQWRNLTVTGRNETAQQLEECGGLGAAAGAGEPGTARKRVEEKGRPSISFNAYVSFFN